MQLKAVLKPLFATMKSVFASQCNVTLSFENSYLQPRGQEWALESMQNVVTTAQLYSPELTFTIAYCFPEEVFLKFVSSMFGEEFKAVTPEIRDLAAEWLNITLGNLKSSLNDELGGNFNNNIPMTVMGDRLVFSADEITPIVVIPVKSPQGNFHCLLILGNDAVIPWDNSSFGHGQ
ncbi:MAG: chemotaxis protein CheX [Oligoflexia bacterium]|nr:chemotaxis protein CheX [Oligoflexia bacterium]MBF0367029.1 chemotaxis protein CheX [Oligoflexia bacterium]